jgi:hypothetical protein
MREELINLTNLTRFMEYHKKNNDVGTEGIGSRGKSVPNYDMGKKTNSRGSLDLDNALASYDGMPKSPKDSYAEQNKKFVKNISADLLG